MSEALKQQNIGAESHILEDVQVSYALLHTAQQTLTDLDKSVAELAKLVEGLKKQSVKIARKTI